MLIEREALEVNVHTNGVIFWTKNPALCTFEMKTTAVTQQYAIIHISNGF